VPDLKAWHRDGALGLRGWLDVEKYIAPLQRQIRAVIDLTRARCGLPASEGEPFDAGLPELLRADRKAVGKLYDAVRKLPAYFAIAAAPPVWKLVARCMQTDLPGWYSQGSGIRMDHPGEDQYLSPWHQEYPTHLGSLDMLVVWLPIVPVDEAVGSVIFCPGSHREGLMPVHLDDPLNSNRNGSKAMEIAGIDRYLRQYPETSIDTEPGDAIILHGLTLHRSRPNQSPRTRWSIQLRYFNYRNETGQRHFWTGGMLAGTDLRAIHPDMVVERS
jgi:ectoine hydroxylase-related dioxygenase (phytanoyl-CoA dioxygenase family)